MNVTKTILQELWIARELLSKPGHPYGRYTWNQYCEDVGIEKRTTNQWLERAFSTGTNVPVKAYPSDSIIDVQDIEENPFWDMSNLKGTSVAWWANYIKETLEEQNKAYYIGLDCIFVVREYGYKYQLVCQHHQLYALKILQVEKVLASVIDKSDIGMKDSLIFEPDTEREIIEYDA